MEEERIFSFGLTEWPWTSTLGLKPSALWFLGLQTQTGNTPRAVLECFVVGGSWDLSASIITWANWKKKSLKFAEDFLWSQIGSVWASWLSSRQGGELVPALCSLGFNFRAFSTDFSSGLYFLLNFSKHQPLDLFIRRTHLLSFNWWVFNFTFCILSILFALHFLLLPNFLIIFILSWFVMEVFKAGIVLGASRVWDLLVDFGPGCHFLVVWPRERGLCLLICGWEQCSPHGLWRRVSVVIF